MDDDKIFGLIGRNISYSFSKKYFEQKFAALQLRNYHYQIFDLQEISEVEKVFAIANLKGFNVTIPFKQSIMPYLDELSEEAADIGAVNTVLIKDGKRTGHNTDAFGFEQTLLRHLQPHHLSALVLGNGGAAKAVQYVLLKHGIQYMTVSRRGTIPFESVTAEDVSTHHIIIQCTPVGTFPDVDSCVPFPFEGVSDRHLVIDLIYNPERSQFLLKAADRGARIVNGAYMLEQQAEKAADIWNIPKK